ncbi:MAG: alpha/beta hydrolase, partial [Planctomycetota bacterium]
LVAPYFAVAPRWYAWPDVETWARAARRLVDWIDSGPEVHGLRDRTHAADFPCYRVLPLDAVLRSFEVARRADDPELLGACTAPVLVLVPSHDTVADPEAMREAHAALGSADKRLETFDDSDHLLFWDRDAEQALHTIVPFLTAP